MFSCKTIFYVCFLLLEYIKLNEEMTVYSAADRLHDLFCQGCLLISKHLLIHLMSATGVQNTLDCAESQKVFSKPFESVLCTWKYNGHLKAISKSRQKFQRVYMIHQDIPQPVNYQHVSTATGDLGFHLS